MYRAGSQVEFRNPRKAPKHEKPLYILGGGAMTLKNLNLPYKCDKFEYVLKDLKEFDERSYFKVAHTDIKLVDSPLNYMEKDSFDPFWNVCKYKKRSVNFNGGF